jgi:hypothetical protein
VNSYPCPALLPVGDGGDYVYIFELYAVVLSYHGFFVCSDTKKCYIRHPMELVYVSVKKEHLHKANYHSLRKNLFSSGFCAALMIRM